MPHYFMELGGEAETLSVIATAEGKAAEPPWQGYYKSVNPRGRPLQ